MPQSYLPPGAGHPVTVPEFDDFANSVVAFKQFADSLVAAGGAAPVGTLMPFVGDAAPSGWALCNGQQVEIALNPVLAGLCSDNRFGPASEGYVKLPDLRAKVVLGVAAGGSVGGTGGSASVTLTEANLPRHSHTVNATTSSDGSVHTHSVGGTYATTESTVPHTHAATTGNDGSHGHGSLTYDVTATGTSGGLAAASAVPNDQRKGLSNRITDGGTHTHSVSVTGAPDASTRHSHSITMSGVTGNANAGHTHTVSGTTAETGGGTAFDPRPPFLTLNYLIKLG